MTHAVTPAPAPSLHCRHLTLAQQVAIWFIRRAFDAGIEATERTARKVFLAQPVAQALCPLAELVDALHRSPLDTPPVHPLRDKLMAHEEYDLLTALALVQHARGSAAGIVERWGWPAAGDAGRVGNALTCIATQLNGAGHRMPCPRSRPVMAAAAVDATQHLDARERLLVDAVRLWVQLAERGEPALPQLDALLRQAGVGPAAMALDAILTHTLSAAVRALDIRHLGCAGLSGDEARIVHAVSCVQRRRRDTAFELLSSWLRPSAVRAALPAVDGIAEALTAAHHRLPLRSWRFAETAGQSHWPDSAAVHSATMH